jgi:pimeloyl-ACP methyl ester carboxylesterase
VRRSAPIDGFSLAYERHGAGPPVVLLHGWPGSRRDYRELVPRLQADADLVVPDLRGFGDSDRHADRPAADYAAPAQAASVLGLVDELGLERPILVGYDVGSRVAQTIAQRAPEKPAGRVLWGREDPLYSLEWTDRIGEFFADAKLELLAGVGHFTPLEAPDAIADAVRALVDQS